MNDCVYTFVGAFSSFYQIQNYTYMSLNRQSILEALVHVRYPGTGKDIVSSGMVQDNLVIEGNKVTFSIYFEKPHDPFAKSVVKAAEQAIHTYVSDMVDIKGNIEIVFKEAPAPKPASILPNVKNIIAVSSGKGGVGKSTVSSNLAISLASLGYKVGLLDADILGPSLPKMFGVEDEHPEMIEIDGKHMIIPIEKYGVKMISIGFFVDPAQALVWRGTVASNALKQLITDTQWGELDFFVMDLPPGTGDIHLTLVQTMGITGAIVVTTPQEVALADARKGINMFTGEKVNVPVLGIVENMAWFTPAELPENKYYIFGKDGGKRLADELSVPLLGQIPLVQSIRECGDAGRPVAVSDDSIMSSAFRSLAENVINCVNYRNSNMEATQKVAMMK